MLIYNTISNFFRNSVISIPIINFIIGCILFDKYLIFLTIGLLLSGLLNYIIKYIIYISFNSLNRKWFLRPINAKGCDACCDDSCVRCADALLHTGKPRGCDGTSAGSSRHPPRGRQGVRCAVDDCYLQKGCSHPNHRCRRPNHRCHCPVVAAPATPAAALVT